MNVVESQNVTYFRDIYCLNNTIKQDKAFCKMPTYLQYALYWRYLQFAISYFQYDCSKNLLDYVPYREQSYQYIGDGIDNEFMLSPTPPIVYPDLYIAIKNPEEKEFTVINQNDYEYESTNCVVTFKNIPLEGAIIKIVAYLDGQFNVELSINEKTILAEGMNIPFLEKNQNNTQLLTQIVYGGTMKIYSQGEHMKQLGNIVNSQRDYVNNLIVNYSYRNQEIVGTQARLKRLSARGSSRNGRFGGGC